MIRLWKKRKRPHHTLSSTSAGVIGNVMEWYDFALFGYFAPIIAGHFFPSDNQLTALLQTYGVFAAGFVMRPLGAVLFGQIGDRAGRARALIASVVMMGAPTFALGLLPTYEQIGLWAPVLLVVVRLVQGLSVGGEFSSSVTYMVESARPNRRGLTGSWANVGSLAGTLLGSGTAAVMASLLSQEALTAWGWRVPFLAGLALAGFALWLRRNLSDTEIFKAHASGHEADNPLHEALTRNLGQTIKALLFACGYGVFFYIPLVYLPTYASTVGSLDLAGALRVNALGMALMLPLIPLAGYVSDRWIRRKYVILGAFALMALAAPVVFMAMQNGAFWALAAGQLLFAVIIAAPVGAAPALFAEMFPTEDRLTGYSLAFNLGLGIVGGSAPMAATFFIQQTGSSLAPGIYLSALCLLSIGALSMVRDRSREPLL